MPYVKYYLNSHNKQINLALFLVLLYTEIKYSAKISQVLEARFKFRLSDFLPFAFYISQIICTQSTSFERQGVFLHCADKEGETERGTVVSLSFVQGISTTNSNLLLMSHFKSPGFFGHNSQHVGFQFPNQGWNPCPLQWKPGVITTGLPWKSQSRML